MILSKFNYLFESEKFGFLIYNSLSNSFIEVNKDLYELISNKQINKIDGDTRKELEELKFFVNETEDYNLYLEQKTAYYLSTFNQKTLGLAIAPTLACNFDCVYCFEQNKTHSTLNDGTIDKIISFIKSYDTIKDLNITWYGGEPLLELDKINILLNKIKKLNLPISRHGMVTNGFLINKEKLEILKEMNLDFIQFTLDGLEETHNKRRTHKNKKIKTYRIILNNIDKFIKKLPKTKILIRIHIDAKTRFEYPLQYKQLKEKWKGKNVNIYPAFLRNDINSCSSSCSAFSEQKEMYNFYYDLYKNHNINVKFFPEYDFGGCNATNLNTFVLGPEGELYKCWNDIGIKERIIGYIDSNKLVNKNILFKYLVEANKYEDESCKSCILFPVCSGGCPYYRVENNISGKDNYPLLCSIGKTFIKEFLELHYEQQINS